MKLSLVELCEHFGGQLSAAQGSMDFSSISTDTRTTKSGDVFVALKGPTFDGHAFLKAAEDKGAMAAIVECVDDTISLPQWCVEDCYKALGWLALDCRKKFSGAVFGITGSSGKTTVKGMLAKVCELAGPTMATRGNLNNHIGVPLTMMEIENHHRYAVIEAGTSNPGEIAYLAGLIQPTIAIVNNVMPVHVEGFGEVEAIAHEKSEMYKGLLTDGVAVVNLDAAHLDVLAAAVHTPQITYSVKSETDADVKAENIAIDELGLATFTLQTRTESAEVTLSVLGEHNVANAVAVAAASLAAGIKLDHIKQGLEAYAGDKGRMQLHTLSNGGVVVDDTYNASPGSVKAAIQYLSGFPQSVLVLGDMGELGELRVSAHRDVGATAKEKNIKTLLCVGEASQFAADAFGEAAIWFESKLELGAYLKNILTGESVVLVKGSRSARMEEVVNALLESGENT